MVVLVSPTIELGINMGITKGDAKYKQTDRYNRKVNISITQLQLQLVLLWMTGGGWQWLGVVKPSWPHWK